MPAGEQDAERTPLDLLPRAVARKRGRVIVVTAVILGAAAGGIVGLIGGRIPGLIAAAVVGLPLLFLAYAEFRRRTWLAGGVVSARSFGTKSVDLRRADRVELLVTEVRGNRLIGMLVGGPPKGKRINIALASYNGDRGRELDILGLRRLADTLASGEEPGGLVFAELLIAQLRSEARGDGAQDRPLYRLVSLVPSGKLAQRLLSDTVTRFVATLDH